MQKGLKDGIGCNRPISKCRNRLLNRRMDTLKIKKFGKVMVGFTLILNSVGLMSLFKLCT